MTCRFSYREIKVESGEMLCYLEMEQTLPRIDSRYSNHLSPFLDVAPNFRQETLKQGVLCWTLDLEEFGCLPPILLNSSVELNYKKGDFLSTGKNLYALSVDTWSYSYCVLLCAKPNNFEDWISGMSCYVECAQVGRVAAIFRTDDVFTTDEATTLGYCVSRFKPGFQVVAGPHLMTRWERCWVDISSAPYRIPLDLEIPERTILELLVSYNVSSTNLHLNCNCKLGWIWYPFGESFRLYPYTTQYYSLSPSVSPQTQTKFPTRNPSLGPTTIAPSYNPSTKAPTQLPTVLKPYLRIQCAGKNVLYCDELSTLRRIPRREDQLLKCEFDWGRDKDHILCPFEKTNYQGNLSLLSLIRSCYSLSVQDTLMVKFVCEDPEAKTVGEIEAQWGKLSDTSPATSLGVIEIVVISFSIIVTIFVGIRFYIKKGDFMCGRSENFCRIPCLKDGGITRRTYDRLANALDRMSWSRDRYTLRNSRFTEVSGNSGQTELINEGLSIVPTNINA